MTLIVIKVSINAVFSLDHEMHEINKPGVSASHWNAAGFLMIEKEGHCSSCPSENHSSDGHRHFSCGNHLSDSLDSQAGHRLPCMQESSLNVFEEYQAFPEVCVRIFIPPDNIA